jgi:peptidoglycan/LPS O-acetylase OafA/YrhL
LAVVSVMVAHWAPGHPALLGVAWGQLGVSLFFVLSGYLITTILAQARDEAEAVGASRCRVLGGFYARRALRILPAYYALIAVLAVAGNGWFWRQPLAFVLHVSNWWIYGLGEWPGELSHLWSLALEEQFYLVWPLVVLFVRRRWLGRVVAGAIVVSAASTLLLVQAAMPVIVPPAAFCAVLVGSALALGLRARPGLLSWAPSAAAALCGVWFATEVLRRSGSSAAAETGAMLASYAAFAAVTAAAVRGVGGPLGSVLEHRAVQRLGKLSYGMYLVHNFGPFAPPAPHPALRLPMLFVLTWLIAEVSFRVLESPVNRRKVRFPYVRHPAAV